MDDTIGEKFIDTIFKYGCCQGHRTAPEIIGKHLIYKYTGKSVPKKHQFYYLYFAFFFLFSSQIPNHFTWLCFFYLTFHSFLNLVGEIMHFADRNFYCDWWNANNIDTFWRSWNMPVHRWCVRHIYIPVVDMGYSRSAASLIVFFISAFFHEYLVRLEIEFLNIRYNEGHCLHFTDHHFVYFRSVYH